MNIRPRSLHDDVADKLADRSERPDTDRLALAYELIRRAPTEDEVLNLYHQGLAERVMGNG